MTLPHLLLPQSVVSTPGFRSPGLSLDGRSRPGRDVSTTTSTVIRDRFRFFTPTEYRPGVLRPWVHPTVPKRVPGLPSGEGRNHGSPWTSVDDPRGPRCDLDPNLPLSVGLHPPSRTIRPRTHFPDVPDHHPETLLSGTGSYSGP